MARRRKKRRYLVYDLKSGEGIAVRHWRRAREPIKVILPPGVRARITKNLDETASESV